MKYTFPKVLLGCLLLAACSKSGTLNELSAERAPARLGVVRQLDNVELPPAPIPADTLEIDSLRHPGTN
ncbi:hypothetical protein [Flaviaesturariibacter aridisoli]|uniref:Uncharacterized protein n=1 Tax=Flaviaesturariibacter aridisoli TaxID=2545761 RepID=A0A4R4E027_9BACT|nr:hypothetical protein [Flaviaesturariibacter aridisoli]TCZ70475.1 hypothetical protein E0486_10995 [Flaviaesturariibacter aridisoli]